MPSEKELRTLGTTETSLNIVQTVQDLDGATMSEIHEQYNIAKSTLYYHLNTLVKLGYLVKEANQYQVGLRFVNHAEYAKNRKAGYRVINRKTTELAEEYTEIEVDFSVEENGRIIVLYHKSGGAGEVGFQEGTYYYTTNTAAGKAILAEFDRDRINEIINHWGFQQSTKNSIGNRESLFSEIETIRERGFAINDQESLDGFRGISAAIKDPDGGVFGALSFSGPIYRFSFEEMNQRYVNCLRRAVSDIESELKSFPDES